MRSPSEVTTRAGADGVGLYRTEFLFMNRAEPPGEQEQYENYRAIVQALKGAPVTIRTIDLGADKQGSTSSATVAAAKASLILSRMATTLRRPPAHVAATHLPADRRRRVARRFRGGVGRARRLRAAADR